MTRASGDGSLIAVVGISCRLPHAPDPQAYWQLLRSGGEAISELPRERWDLAGDAAGALGEERGARLGGFLEGVDRFDPAFFGISPREAAAMDPQQRLALELAWEALEDAGIAPSAIRGDAAGVFLGAIAGDYASLVDRLGPEAIDRHTATGLHRSIIANRISYALGLGGPSLTVDAAQSASLVAVHLACESLRRGESRLALAGGVHLNLDPRGALGAARLGALSPDGRCFAFDARANGFVRGEGGGIVVLKPLAEARAAGDRVYCLVRGSAVNNDGGGVGLTAPSQAAQEAVLGAACRRAGVKRSELQYVELHGSGTPTGDPIEAAALGGVLGAGRGGSDRLPVGSAKTNIGHLEGAAGIAGMIKVALAIDRREIPPSLNFERPNPAIPLEELGLRVQDELGPWPHGDRALLAGVSSFGVGGTNCHVVLSETTAGNQKKSSKTKNPSDPGTAAAAAPLPGVTPLVLSAASRPALRAQAERLAAHLEGSPELDLADVGWSLATTRSHLRQRAAVVAADRAQLLSGLAALAAGADGDGVVTGSARAEHSPVFLFPGQGSQWLGMGVELAEASAVFRGYLEECEEALAPHLDFSVRDALTGADDAASLDRVDVIQPTLFAVMVSLARLWRRCGVMPAAVVGHSQGEVAAAYIAGGLSLEDAALIAAVRSRLIQDRAGEGALVSVALSARSLEPLLAPFGDRLTVAAHNGPAAAIVSGERGALDQLLEICAARQVRARDLLGGIFASHSAYVEPMRDDLLEALAGVSPRSGSVPFHSTVTGGPLDTAELDAEYWYRNLRRPVRFEPVMRQLLDQGRRLFVEISAHPVFAVAVEGTIEDVLGDPEEATVLATLRREQGGPERFARSLAEAHVAGAAVDWAAHFPAAKRVKLPTYAFQRQRYWLDEANDDGTGDGAVADAGEGLAAELPGLPAEEQEGRMLALVRGEVAKLLGLDNEAAVEPDLAFKDLGFDSAAAADLRKRLRAASGLPIGSTVVFDYPTSVALARHLLALTRGELGGGAREIAVRARRSDEPIAIVGIGCHLPGGIDSPEQLWELVAEGRDGIVPFPADRGWDLGRIYDPDPAHAGTSYVREGGFLADPADFDAEFFGIAPREAIAMDPQQRLLLETSWEALEDAGIDPRELKGEPAGVFAGAAKGDYSSAVEGYKMIGGLASVLAGRVSYTLGLEGPALSVDTACSSSLVAMHLAIAALHRGECSLALAGGVTVHATPAMFVDFSRQRVLAPDGRSKSFGAGANGAGWSEGVGMLVLERLSAAERNGHRVLATIRGSAVNQDGASNGLSAPNGPAQERVIRQALANAGLDSAEVDAVEAHGTGTALGDPLEAGALIATYGRERERPLKLGSIKSNIGHTLGAAGVAGVIKMTMAMRAGVLPKTLHAESPSAAIEWDSAGVELLNEPVVWEPAGRPRRAAVSSFGISGTNAHLILEEPPAASARPGAESAGGPADSQPLPGALPLVLSAKTEPALRAQAERLASHLRKSPDLDLADVAYSLASERAAFEQRAAVVGDSREEALAALDSLAAGSPGSPSIARGTAGREAKVAFLFPGQGSQWQGMGLELLESSPVFARSMGECEEALAPHLDFVLRDVLAGVAGAPSIERIEVVQPALFAVMVSLARLWRACGVEPAAAAGHSQGEIAAAHLAGGLSLEDAARLAAVRSRLISKLAGKGGMVSLITPRERVERLIEPWRGTIEVAAHNGPSSTIVSGTRGALDELLALCAEQDGVRAREVPAAIASHSHHVEALRDEVLEAFAGLSPRSGSIPFYSTVTGGPLDTAELDAEYWYRNLRRPVLFERVARGLIEGGYGSLVEVSPHPVFTLAVGETIERAAAEHGRATVIETLRREEGGARRFAISLAQAHVAGAPVDWSAFFAGSGARAVPLPTYPFQRKRYWLNPAAVSSDPTILGQRALEHPFLAAAIEEPEGEGVAFSGRVSLSEHPWLADHAVFGSALLPGTAFLELALFSGRQLGAPTVAELTLQAPLLLSEAAVALRVSVSAPDQGGRREIAIHSRPEGDEEAGWTRNASGELAADAAAVPEPLPQWPPRGAESVAPADLHARLAEAGFEYGAAFQGLTAAWRDGDDLYAEVSLPAGLGEGAGGFSAHPALLDACLHPVALGAGEGVKLPFSWSGVSLSAVGARELRVKISAGGEGGTSLALFDALGAAVGQVDSLLARPLTAEQMGGMVRAPLYGLRWERLARAQPALPPAELWRAPGPGQGVGPVGEATTATLGKIQQWLATEPEDSRLAILTEAALAIGQGEAPDPATAALWGLVRSAASEHPGRFLLIDSDGSEASEAALEQALAADPQETQLALREGELLVPRLVAAKGEEGETVGLDPERTVLITGGTGGLGALVAQHLVEAHGARRLLLASRSGEWARGGAGLRTQLGELGAAVEIATCDVSDRSRLEELLGQVSDEHPLGAVIHCAGVLDDATVQAASAEQLERVFAAKADAAWHLHELTAGLELSHFICFSSIAGIVGSPGQGAYAAANCFLDGLAARRRAEGLPATSIAWGLWQRESGMASRLTKADLARMRRAGVEALSEQQGLALFDAALLSSRPLVAAARFDRAALRAQAATGGLPALLEGLVPTSSGAGAASAGVLSLRLLEAPEGSRERLAEDFVRAEVAAILGHASAEAVGLNDAFKDLGFDSLAAVELRNRLNLATGLQLPATVVFDYPDAGALSRKILGGILGSEGAAEPASAQARSSEEPIAIVGMACRYPGGVSSPAELWRLVEAERDAIAALPADRGWDPASIYVLDPGRPELGYSRAGGFLADAAEFDPGFFSISPREAVAIDPQQRLALESSWEALEDAGIDPHRLRGSSTGVFAGVMHHDYGVAVDDSSGMAAGAASGRVSYALGLEGPAITVDTACSSSLVATHLAAGALRGGECDLALAGGSTVLATPAVFGYFSRQQGLARDGRCKAFSEAADGVGISEGVGVLVLERLSDAEANGRRVWATIKGSAINQDGASNGLTAPNGPSQERVIRQALANAGLKPAEVEMVEAHGTGTALGDPIEAGALLATYGQEREEPVRIGSLKSNIGHAQAAAGVAGVIKAVMAMREGTMPKTLHVDQPSSKVEWGSGKVELLSEAVEWEANGRPRRAGVSSFGASGTNAHLILEEAPVAGRDPGPGASPKDLDGEAVTPSDGPVPFLLSAKTPEALAAQAERLVAHWAENPDQAPADLAYSLATTRARLEQRAVVVGSEREELLSGLNALARGEQTPGTVSGKATPGARLACLFTGQGSQRAGMGRELFEAYPAYSEAFEEACAEIDPHLGRSLKELVFCEPGTEEAELLDHTTYAQPALFATGLALHRLLESFGLRPELLAGHSIGEITAAHISGVFSLQGAARLVCARGALMGALPEGGAMLAIEATEQEVLASIEGSEEKVSLAAVNSPNACVISGTEDAIEALETHWREQGQKTKRLAVSHAFHSPLMEPMLEQFEQVASSLSFNEPRVPVVSCLTGELLGSEQATDPSYWVTHVREPVRFADAVVALAKEGASAFIELGPDPVLCAMARECLEGEHSEPVLVPTLRQGRPEPESVVGALAQAHAAGAPVDWSAFFAGTEAKTVALPTYPFQRRRYWLNPASAASDPAALGQRALEHPFLAAAIEEPEGEGIAFSGRVSLAEHPWLADHAVLGTAILPGTAFLELALFAGQEAGTPAVEELTLQAPLALSEGTAVALRVSLSAPDEQGRREIAIHSRPEGEAEGWTRNAGGVLGVETSQPPAPLPQWPPAGGEPLDLEDLRARLAEAGFEYGEAFQGLSAAWRQGSELYAELSLPERLEAGGFGVHPALLDAALHPLALAAGEEVRLPFSWNGVSLPGCGTRELRVRVAVGEEGASLLVFDGLGTPIGAVESLLARPLDPEQMRAAASAPLFELGWQKPATSYTALPPAHPWHLPEQSQGAKAAREATLATLEQVQRWLAEEPEDSRLAILTEGAVATRDGEAADPATAALCGLVRSAASEHPGRFLLVDTDGSEASEAALEQALAADPDETQLALREGELLVPRLAAAKGEEGETAGLDPERTVLITGGTGGIGALVAEHLVEAHGARNLILAGRSGEQAPGALDLRARLQEAGAEVRIAACDVSDRGRLEALLDSISTEHPLGAVIHCAGVLDDATVEAVGPDQLERVFAAKADAAWHLHELTAGLELSHFVCFSSIAGIVGSPGQGAYAAANCFLDGLAARRRAEGLPATSIAWGFWGGESGMAGRLGDADLARMRRAGVEALSEQQGLALFDAAMLSSRPLVAAARFDRAALRAQAGAGGLPALLKGLVPVSARAAAAATGALSRRLGEAPEAARGRLAEDFVRAEVAAILGHASAEAVGPGDSFKDLGFDSLAAVELRNRLGAAVGRRLAASIVFDYPTAAALAAHLLAEAGEVGPGAAPELARLERSLAGMPGDDPARAQLATRLRALAAELEGGARSNGDSVSARLEGASDEELLEFIDTQVGADRG